MNQARCFAVQQKREAPSRSRGRPVSTRVAGGGEGGEAGTGTAGGSLAHGERDASQYRGGKLRAAQSFYLSLAQLALGGAVRWKVKLSRTFLPVVAGLLVTASVHAKDVDPAREESARLVQQASQAKAEGREEEARQLSDKAKDLAGEARKREREKKEREAGDGSEAQERFATMKRQVQELRTAGKHEEADRLNRELHEKWKRERPKAEKSDKADKSAKRPGPSRVRHIRKAARHLREADMERAAERLAQAAKRMTSEAEQSQKDKGERRGRDRKKNHRVSAELRELHEQVEKLGQEVGKLREEMQRQKREGDRP